MSAAPPPFTRSELPRTTKGGSFKHFSIATPIGDLTFRFIEKNNWEGFSPGFDTLPSMTVINKDNYRYKKIDHITCNVMTMSAVDVVRTRFGHGALLGH